MDDAVKYSMLLDYYGGLLTERQREVSRLYHDENLTLAEIAEEFGISRQGVYDTLKKTEHALDGYETKLSLAGKLKAREEILKDVDRRIDTLLEEYKSDHRLAEKMTAIKQVIDSLEE